jgi:hypothetical protein
LTRRRFIKIGGAVTGGGFVLQGLTNYSFARTNGSTTKTLKCTSDPISAWNTNNPTNLKSFGANGATGTLYSLPVVALTGHPGFYLQINAVPSGVKKNDTGDQLTAVIDFTAKMYNGTTVVAEMAGQVSGTAAITAGLDKIYFTSASTSGATTSALLPLAGQSANMPSGSYSIGFALDFTPANATHSGSPCGITLGCKVKLMETTGSGSWEFTFASGMPPTLTLKVNSGSAPTQVGDTSLTQGWTFEIQ